MLASGAIGVAKPSRKIFDRALDAVGAAATRRGTSATTRAQTPSGRGGAGLHALHLDPFDLYARLDAHGIVRAPTLTAAVDRILVP